MALNVTTAVFAENCNTATASPSLAQWDTEQVLQISGIELPDSYKVEFSTVYTRNAIPAIGDASGVTIPNLLLQRSAPITAYVVLYGENGGRNREYWITIYITPGQPPETITPDPEQADVIDEAIAALNNGVARTEDAAAAAEESARDAEAAAEAVQNLSVAAETLATGEPATVEKTVDPETGAVTLNFGLPRGAKGDPFRYEDFTEAQKAELVQGPIKAAQDAAVEAVNAAGTTQTGNVNQAGTTNVNAVNQAGTTNVNAVNQAGTTQVNAVNQAGAAQVQAVEDKGDEVLNSIPQDYSDLVDDVADLSRQLSDVEESFNEKCTTYVNMFDPSFLLEANNWNQSGTEYYGSAFDLSQKYNAQNPYPTASFESSTPYIIEFDAKTAAEAGSTGNGLRLTIEYTDSTIDRATALNSYNEYTHVSFTSNSTKTVKCIYFGYGTSGSNVWHIKNIMIAKVGTPYNYLPYLIPADYYSRDKIADVDANITLMENDITRLKNNANNFVPLVTPDGFSWQNHPLAGKVGTDYRGYYTFDFDVSAYDVSGQGVTYYVDASNGNDNNSGLTADLPLKKMSTAYDKQDCSCIMLADGIYSNVVNLNAVTIAKDIAIKAFPGAKPIIATHSGSTFALYDGNTYSANRGSCARVVDLSNTNPYGDPLEYAKLDTAADVVATAGSWALIDRILYVHCIDNREPDKKLLLLINTNNLYCEGNPNIYLEGLTVISGNSPLRVSNTDTLTNPKVYAKNCDFLYSETINNDVVMLQGTELSIFQNCRALYGMKDGFNYHAKNGTIPKAIEINCVGAMCGNTEDSNDQGSTIHDGGSAIRIGCIYFKNQGSNVADEASESWNVGCVAFEPLAPNSGQRGNFYALTNTKMWLDSCRGFGKPHYNVLSATDDTTEVYFRNNTFENGDKTVSIYGTTPIYY